MIDKVSLLTQTAGGISELLHLWSSPLPGMLSSKICMAVSFSLLRSWFKCHVLKETYPDTQFKVIPPSPCVSQDSCVVIITKAKIAVT